MKCPKCQFENPDNAKFCIECASPMEFHCPNCEAITPATGKFCQECAYDLRKPKTTASKEISFDEKLTKIQKYLPKGLTEKILSQKDRIEGERKHVTVMFCDMVGFTQFSETIGPEETYSIMEQVYEILIHKVHDYEGTVNEFTGDGIMALFGAPISVEDAPQRAIRSAHAIHREMARFSATIKQKKRGLPQLKMRIGIHTGPVVVGTLGNDLRVEFKAVGDTVNLASRMEGLAESGSTYVTEDIFKLTDGIFRFEALGEHAVKGKADTVKAYRVIAPSTRRTRFDVSAERGLTLFVGRERELEILLEGFERAKEGKGQVFSIMSEAGVGKSRVLYEFRKTVANDDLTFMEGKCLSFSRGVAYHPVIDIVKSNFDIIESDNDFEIKEKLKRGLKILNVDDGLTLPYLLQLLSVEESGAHLTSLSPEARKDQIIEALNRITIKASRIRPLVMAIEDLHWIDKSSEDWLKSLLNRISGERVFLIFTYRPEYGHAWGAKSYHSQINLNRLSIRNSLAMMSHLLATEEIDRELEKLILEKTEGVPFFIEEFIKSLKGLKIIEIENNTYRLAKDMQKLTIPSTVQEVIMARVDSLPNKAKEVLQIGSVIEREFSYNLIKQVVDFAEKELLSQLSALNDFEIIYQRGIYPDTTYTIKHAITRDVIYDTLLTKKKKEIHEKTGEAIERLYERNIGEYYGVLAEHFFYSENYEKSAKYSRLAAKRALKAGSIKDAVKNTLKRVSCLEKLQNTVPNQRKVIDARTTLANFYMSLNDHVEAKNAVNPIVDLTLELDYQSKLPSIYLAIGSYNLVVEEELSKASKYLTRALKIAKKENNFISIWMASYDLGICMCYNCNFEKGEDYFNDCLYMSKISNNLTGISFAKSFMSCLCYTPQGKLDLAYELSEESVKIAQKSNDIFAMGMAYSTHGIICYHRGLFEYSEECLLKSLVLNERAGAISQRSLALGYLGYVYLDKGKNEKAQAYLKESIESKYNPSWIVIFELSLIKAEVLSRKRNIILKDLSKYNEKNRLKAFSGFNARFISEIFMNIDDTHIAEAKFWIAKAVEMDQRNGIKWSLGMDYSVYAELFNRKGDSSKTKEYLCKAIEIFKECGADGWVEKYEKELTEL